MKTILLALLIATTSSNSFGQYKYEIEIRTSSLEKSKMTLYIYEGSYKNIIDKIPFSFKNGIAKITGKINEITALASISSIYNNQNKNVNFVIDTGMNRMNLNLSKHTALNSLEISNFNSLSYQIYSERLLLYKKMAADFKKENKLIHTTEMPVAFNTQFALNTLELLGKYPNSYYALFQLSETAKTVNSIAFSNSVLVTLNKFNIQLRNLPLGKKILENKTIQINGINAAKTGKTVPFFTVNDSKNLSFTNESLTGQNYVIAFSATWCFPCIEQLPMLQRIYNTYKDKGLKVIYFNDDDDLAKWKAEISSKKLDWINVSEGVKAGKSKIPHLFGVYSIPVYLIINAENKIIYNSNEEDRGLEKFELSIKNLYKTNK